MQLTPHAPTVGIRICAVTAFPIWESFVALAFSTEQESRALSTGARIELNAADFLADRRAGQIS